MPSGWAKIALIAGMSALNASCSPPAPPPVPAGTAQATFPHGIYERAARSGQTVYTVDAERSRLRVFISRAGPLAGLGHDHVIRATQMTGAAVLPEDSLADARMDLWIPAAGLEVDPPALRTELGGAFAEAISAENAAATRTNMLGAAVLDARRYPRLRMHLQRLSGAMPYPVAEVSVRIRGDDHLLRAPLHVASESGGIRVSGRVAVDHAALGLTPFTAAGGALRVGETIVIGFSLVGMPR